MQSAHDFQRALEVHRRELKPLPSVLVPWLAGARCRWTEPSVRYAVDAPNAAGLPVDADLGLSLWSEVTER